MSKPFHTPGPVNIGDDGELYSAAQHRSVAMVLMTEDGVANARLLAAAYNAFDSAAKKLGVNAVELAERMQDSAIADLVKALEIAEHALGNATRPDCWRDFEDLKVWAESMFLPVARAILSEVNGVATTTTYASPATPTECTVNKLVKALEAFEEGSPRALHLMRSALAKVRGEAS